MSGIGAIGSVGSAEQSAFYASYRAGGRAADRQEPDMLAQMGVEQKGREAQNALDKVDSKAKAQKGECKTCKNRTYQDGSNDPGVSFKTPQKVDPKIAASAVAGHEREHVFREQAKAKSEGREIVSQSVTLHTGICSECGKTFVAGGTTRTVSRSVTAKDAARFQVGLPGAEDGQKLLAQI